jgi:hypothetical protein
MLVKISITFIFLLGLIACTKQGTPSSFSKTGKKKSHNMGLNCMSCHKFGGSGEGVFKFAGTVYDTTYTQTNPDCFVDFYTGPKGTGKLLKRIPVDGLGNFYSSGRISRIKGLYPSVVSATGNVKYMGGQISSGECNSCHGVTSPKIWVKN